MSLKQIIESYLKEAKRTHALCIKEASIYFEMENFDSARLWLRNEEITSDTVETLEKILIESERRKELEE